MNSPGFLFHVCAISRMRKTAIFLVISLFQAKAFHLLNRFHVQLSSRANPLHSDVTEGDRPPKSKLTDEEVSKFLTDFRTAQGNLVNPCKEIFQLLVKILTLLIVNRSNLYAFPLPRR